MKEITDIPPPPLFPFSEERGWAPLSSLSGTLADTKRVYNISFSFFPGFTKANVSEWRGFPFIPFFRSPNNFGVGDRPLFSFFPGTRLEEGISRFPILQRFYPGREWL